MNSEQLPCIPVCAMPHYEGLRPCHNLSEGLRNECGPRPGYVVEVVNIVFQCMRRCYQLVYPEDLKFGAYNSTSETWDGMMGDLALGRCKMTLPYMYAVAERLRVFKYFSTPLRYLKIMLVFNDKTLENRSRLGWWRVLPPVAPGIMLTAKCIGAGLRINNRRPFMLSMLFGTFILATLYKKSLLGTMVGHVGPPFSTIREAAREKHQMVPVVTLSPDYLIKCLTALGADAEILRDIYDQPITIVQNSLDSGELILQNQKLFAITGEDNVFGMPGTRKLYSFYPSDTSSGYGSSYHSLSPHAERRMTACYLQLGATGLFKRLHAKYYGHHDEWQAHRTRNYVNRKESTTIDSIWSLIVTSATAMASHIFAMLGEVVFFRLPVLANVR